MKAVTLECKNCHKYFNIPSWRLKDKRRGKFCSANCSQKYHSGENSHYWGLNRKGANSPSWKGGRPNCIDCGKQLSIYTAKRCNKCQQKVSGGENSSNWRGGISIGFNNCLDCKKQLSDNVAKRCRECYWKSLIGRKLTREHIRNSLRRKPMSSLEIKFNEIIIKNNLPYKFVGNGKFSIERKVPDFININGEKKAIEVYAIQHKNLFRGGVEQWKKDRSELFAKYGWETLFFDAMQITEDNVLRVLKEGLCSSNNPISFRAWLHERESTIFLMLRFLPILNDPAIPLSSQSLMPPLKLFIRQILSLTPKE